MHWTQGGLLAQGGKDRCRARLHQGKELVDERAEAPHPKQAVGAQPQPLPGRLHCPVGAPVHAAP